MKLSSLDLDQAKKWLNNSDKEALINLVTDNFKNVDPEKYFTETFESNDAFSRKLRVYYHQNKVVGYCLISFIKNEQDVLIKASAAFYPQYRQGGNTFAFSLKQAFLFWLSNPRKNIYYAGAMVSPAMYRAIAKKAAIVWPSEGKKTPDALFEQFNASGMISPSFNLRCLMNVGISSNYTEQDLRSFRASTKQEINFYCRVNPNFDQGSALFVIMPITLKQLLLTGLKRLTASIH